MSEDFIEHAVIANTDVVGVLCADQLFVSVWKWMQSEVLDGTDDSCDLI